MRLETERLILREMTANDLGDLYEILSDAETMAHYPRPFDRDKVRNWIQWNADNYETFGFGLWAVVLKDGGRLIGDCGATMQTIQGKIRPEIGYHIHKAYQNRGYATEAARKCRDELFVRTPFGALYTYLKHTNAASGAVALKNGMRFVEAYEDPVNEITRVYAITRAEWETKTEAGRRARENGIRGRITD